jgi:hypothetical protein
LSGPRRTAFAATASVAVVIAVVAGMVALGSPADQRARRLDQRRIEDLRALANGIEYKWRTDQTLPRSLDELPAGFARGTRDPGTGRPYEYSVRAGSRYEICATFDRDNTDEAERPWPGHDDVDVAIWTHGAGRNCFELEPSPEAAR